MSHHNDDNDYDDNDNHTIIGELLFPTENDDLLFPITPNLLLYSFQHYRPTAGLL